MENTDPHTAPRTCRRCKGWGIYRGYGICYGCNGRGIVIPAPKLTDEEVRAANAEYRATQAHREARAAAREARRQARGEAA